MSTANPGRIACCLLLPLVLAGCQPAAAPVAHPPVQYPAANLDDDTYEPGPGWQLAWADEFENDTLDPRDWRRQVVEANIHYADAAGNHATMGAVAYSLDAGRFADAFHVFEIEWDAEEIQWFVDGERFASTSIAANEFSEFHQPFFILLNIAVGGRAAGRPDDTTPFPQTLYVDWVRVYQ